VQNLNDRVFQWIQLKVLIIGQQYDDDILVRAVVQQPLVVEARALMIVRYSAHHFLNCAFPRLDSPPPKL
jgi:hypothetical protein